MSTNITLNYPKERIRIAVIFFFIAQGLCFSCFFSRLPDIKAHFGIDRISELGYLLTLLPIGKFAAIPLVGFLLSRVKSKLTTTISILGFIISLLMIGFSPNIYVLGIFLFIFGMFWNMTDISLNTQAIEVERIYGKAIIATFHATWSISACVGALIGFIMINLNIPIASHFVIVSIFTISMVLINMKYLLANTTPTAEAPKEEVKAKKSKFKMPETILIQLGIIWLFALIIENTIFDWSDIYFQSVIKAPESLRIGFLICMVMISVGRFLTNTAYRIWSKNIILMIAGSLLFIGFTITGLFFDIESLTLRMIVNSFGFMLIGLGISCVVPTIYSIVGDKAKTPIGSALTIMSSISFIGPLIAPSLVGEISTHSSMNRAYLVIGLFGLFIVLIAMFSKSIKYKK